MTIEEATTQPIDRDDCIFCRILAGEIPAHVIDENDAVIVLLSLENHPLVIQQACISRLA